MPPMFTAEGLAAARDVVLPFVPPTPQYAWPLLREQLGCEVWVKHENHTPTGAFKIRGGLVLLASFGAGRPEHLVSATRGNHGQSIAMAGRLHGVRVTIVVPEGNDPDQDAAIRGHGAELVVAGHDFQVAREHAARIGERDGAWPVPVFHPELVRGVATYAAELFDAAGELDAVYVPVGMGSGICGLITARDVLGLRTEIVGVVAAGAPAYALSFAAGRPVSTARADTIADGVATRSPDPAALDVVLAGAADVIQVQDDEIRAAMLMLHRCTHNTAEGAGAVALAGLVAQREQRRGQRVGVVLSGGNITAARLAEVLAG
jgi:threonine dehydratase